jgi:hypothetical protein
LPHPFLTKTYNDTNISNAEIPLILHKNMRLQSLNIITTIRAKKNENHRMNKNELARPN